MPGKFYPHPGRFTRWLWQQAASWIWGYERFQTRKCVLSVSLSVCLSVCGNIIRYASRAKMKKISQSLSLLNLLLSLALSLFPSPSVSFLSLSLLFWWDLWQENRPHPYFPLSLPPQKLCRSPTVITSRDLTTGRGRFEGKSQKTGTRGSAAPLHCALEWTPLNLATLLRAHCTWDSWSEVPCPPTWCQSLCQNLDPVLPRKWIWGTKLPALQENPVLSYSFP